MKKDTANDKQYAAKILAHILDMAQVLEYEKIKSDADLENSVAAKFAITQLITNIYELTRRIQPTALKDLREFANMHIKDMP